MSKIILILLLSRLKWAMRNLSRTKFGLFVSSNSNDKFKMIRLDICGFFGSNSKYLICVSLCEFLASKKNWVYTPKRYTKSDLCY